VRDPKGVCRSRERAAAFGTGKTLGRERFGQRAVGSGKRERGWAQGYCVATTVSGKKPRRGKSPRGNPTEEPGQTPGLRAGSLAVCQTLKGSPSTSVRRANLRRVSASERAYGTVGGMKAPEGKPHERDRDGTDPAGLGGSKASRG
jgi:hypothetical protein